MTSENDSQTSTCPECGAILNSDQTCTDFFYQMLFWENDDPSRGVVHHLLVLCYHLQHPSLYSAEGLANGRQLLADFIERGLKPEEARKRNSTSVDSGKREWTVTARPGNEGAYERPISWTMTAADVVAGGAANYVENVLAWARASHNALRQPVIDKQ